MEMRRCKVCGEEQPLTEFFPQSKDKSLRVHQCKRCVGNRTRLRQFLGKGLDRQDVQRAIDRSAGRCDICGQPPDRYHLCVDHHGQKVRGCLCGKCNKGLGLFTDDIALLHRAIEYLKSAGGMVCIEKLQRPVPRS